MDFNTRINRIDQMIERLEHVERVVLACPAPISQQDWNNSKAREAAEELVDTMDHYLDDYNDKYQACIRALRSLRQKVESQKWASYYYHRWALYSIPEEDHATYIRSKDIDPSVKQMLR
ncbi:hypothetical protein [Gracilibacillus saliphilus]|uniref:hypothetical protein n=1 Tax=Gracilibacillus saliphilus TaxID=543890 RepID=UPI0013CF875F|nr:hypothetical protein [Gracilibacillus saliphilus]